MKGLLKPLAAITILGLTACGAEKTSEEYLASANQYLAAGESDAAIIELKNSLRISSDNLEARLLLGDAYYNQGLYSEAEKEYRRADKAGIDSNKVVPKLALAYFQNYKFDDVSALLDKYPKLSPEAGSTLAAVQALSLFAQGKPDEAKDYLVIAEQKQSDNIYTRLGKATLAADSDADFKTAQQTVEEVLEIAPNSLEANLLYGRLLMAQTNYQAAEETFTKVLNIAPTFHQATLYLVQSQIKQGKIEEAKPYLAELLAIAPNHPLINEFKARILFAEESYNEAGAFADIAIQNGSREISSFVISGISAMKQNKLEQAYRTLTQVKDSLPPKHIVSRIYAYLQLQLGYTDDAVKTLDRLSNLTSADAELFSSATAVLSQSGKQAKALDYAQKAASLDDSGANTVKLGMLKLSYEDQSGLDDIGEAIKNNPNLIEARFALVYGLLKKGEMESARTAADDMLKVLPDHPQSLTLKGLVERAAGNTTIALQQFDKALAIEPHDAVALMGKANTLEEQGESEQAFELYKTNLKYNSDKPFIAQNFIAYSGRKKRTPEATEWAKQLFEAEPDNASFAWAYSIGLAVNNQKELAVTTLESLKPEQQNVLTQQLLGDLLIQTNQLDKAEKAYEFLLEANPKQAKPYQRLIAVNELQRDFSDALKYTQQVLKLFPDNQSLKLVEATMLYEKEQYGASQKALNELNKETIEHPVAVRLKARLATRNKDYKAGLSLWQEYYEKQPNARALVSVASLLELNNKHAEAIQLLEQDIDKFTDKVPVHIKLAELYLANNRQQSAKHYEAALALDGENIMALNNAAWLLMEFKQYPKAESYAKKAYELSKQQPLIGDTYGLTLLKQNNAKQALVVLEAAYEAQSSNNEIALHYAQALIANNDKPKAKNLLKHINPEKEGLKRLKQELMAQL